MLELRSACFRVPDPSRGLFGLVRVVFNRLGRD